MTGSSRAAYSMTTAGHAEAAVEHDEVVRRPCRGGASRRPTTPVAHGVVPCAMSPSTVTEPVEQRRPTARSCIGERSWASSSTTCPRLGTVAAGRRPRRAGPCRPRVQRAVPLVRAGLSHSSIDCSCGVRSSPAAAREGGRVGPQPVQHSLRVERRPHRRDIPLDRRRAGDRRPARGRRGRPRRAPSRGARGGRGAAAAGRGRPSSARRERRARRRARATTKAGTRHLRTPRGTTSGLGRGRDARPHRPAQHRGEAGVALEGRDLGRLLGAHPAVVEQALDRRVAHAHLAEGGQHGADVVEEGPVGSDDEHACAVEALAEGVEQPGGPVQPDGGLAGARGALHADAHREVAPDDRVLLGLDRRDDVAHRAGSRPLDLGGEDRARRRARSRLGGGRAGGSRIGVGRAAQVLVLEGGQPASVDAEAPAQHDVHRVGGGGPVEGSRHRCPPVDDDGVPLGRRRRGAGRCGSASTAQPRGLRGRSGRRRASCAGRPAARRSGGRAPGPAPRRRSRRSPRRRRATRPRCASGPARPEPGRGEPARAPRSRPTRGQARRGSSRAKGTGSVAAGWGERDSLRPHRSSILRSGRPAARIVRQLQT